MIFLIEVGIACEGLVGGAYFLIGSEGHTDDIIDPSCSIYIFSEFFLGLCLGSRVYSTLGFFYDILVGVGIFGKLVGNSLRCSSSENIVGEGDEEFFSCRLVVSTHRDESILCIVGVFVLSLVVYGIADEVPVVVVEETSLERASICFWVVESSRIGGSCTGGSGIGSS